MISLQNSLAAWGGSDFEETLKSEIEKLTVDQLPLQQAITSSSYALDTNIKPIIISSAQTEDLIQVKAGIFYTGIIAGCNCADDPSPGDEVPEYCVVMFEINKSNAQTSVSLLNE